MATSTKNSDTVTEATVTETTAVEKDKQILFKVSPETHGKLKFVATLEGKDGFQDLFASIANDLVEKYADVLDVLFAAVEANKDSKAKPAKVAA